MADNKKFSQEMKNYYDSLPSNVQESISQSSSNFNDLNELRSFADELQNNRNSNNSNRNSSNNNNSNNNSSSRNNNYNNNNNNNSNSQRNR